MLGVGALLLLYGGVMTARSPFWTYPNYWGGAVFAPFVAVLGAALMVLSPFRLVSSDSGEPVSDRDGVRFAHEDVSRPRTPVDQ